MERKHHKKVSSNGVLLFEENVPGRTAAAVERLLRGFGQEK